MTSISSVRALCVYICIDIEAASMFGCVLDNINKLLVSLSLFSK